MNIKEFKKILGGSFSFGLVGLGAYNLYWFVYYFMHGRDINVLPPKIQLFTVDIAVLVTVTVIMMLLEVIRRKLRRKKPDDSGRAEDK